MIKLNSDIKSDIINEAVRFIFINTKGIRKKKG